MTTRPRTRNARALVGLVVAGLTLAAAGPLGHAPPVAARQPDVSSELSLIPTTGLRGSEVAVTGTWSVRETADVIDTTNVTSETGETNTTNGDPALTLPVTMDGIKRPVGSATLLLAAGANAASIDGQATIPLAAAEGLTTLRICLVDTKPDVRGDVDADTGCLVAAFTVEGPSLTVDPAQAAVGDRVQLYGAGWCCPGDDGAVTEQGTGQEWAGATVDRSGALAAVAVVGDLVPGPIDLQVCVRDRCRTATLTVLEGPITGVPSTVPVPTTTRSPETTGTGQATSGTLGTGGLPGGSGGSGSSSTTVPGSNDPSVPTRPVTDHRDLPPLAALVALLAAMTATTAALVLVVRRLGLRPRRQDHQSRERRQHRRSTRPRVEVLPGSPTFTTLGRDGPAPSISIALDLDAGATTLHEVTP